MLVDLIDLGGGFFVAGGAFGGFGRPVFPAREIFLEHETRPAVVAILEQHSAVEFVEVGGGFGGGQGHVGDGDQLLFEGLAFFNQRGGGIVFSGGQVGFGLAVERGEILRGLCVPGFAGGIGGCGGRAGGSAGGQNRRACNKDKSQHFQDTRGGGVSRKYRYRAPYSVD